MGILGILTTYRLGCPTSINIIKIISCRHTHRPVWPWQSLAEPLFPEDSRRCQVDNKNGPNRHRCWEVKWGIPPWGYLQRRFPEKIIYQRVCPEDECHYPAGSGHEQTRRKRETLLCRHPLCFLDTMRWASLLLHPTHYDDILPMTMTPCPPQCTAPLTLWTKQFALPSSHFFTTAKTKENKTIKSIL